MPTISAHIDKSLKDKLTSKAHKEDKTISDLVKKALNHIDFDKEGYREIDDKTKTKEEREAITPILKSLNNLAIGVRKIENSILELTKMQVKLGEIIIKLSREHERERIRGMQSQDANRTYLHNRTIEALEKTTDKNLKGYKGCHPNLHK